MIDEEDILLERRKHILLTENLIEEISERAAEKAIVKMESKMYQTVGKTFINKLFQFIGVLIVSLALYLNHKGFLKF